MQYSVLINQSKALEWGLNSQQAMLFAFLYEAPSWADATEVDGVIYSFVSKSKVVEELPLLTDKPDTAYRLMRQLQDKGVILLTSMGRRTLVAITDLGAEWNRDRPRKNIRATAEVGKKSEVTTKTGEGSTSEKYPRRDRKNIRGAEKDPANLGKISDRTSEKFPTDHITSNQITKSSETQGRSSRGTRLPDDWQPGPEYFAAATEINPRLHNLQIIEIANKFRDYWIARSDRGAVKRDWLATWRNWVRRERGMPQIPPDGPAGPQRTRDRSAVDIATDVDW